ncbi:OsmC family protein [Pedobacter flavus]|uniref:OsmC family protein n=1 Tax=Pedobacter flavus TaxID=3113906 RepID=A0ABU7H0M3_9SPHI|nr:OsmC family protein [Pedobacter sp. VNH31]MEE1884778.1 OsmC family protein [Pedobacter sp. VNH31]
MAKQHTYTSKLIWTGNKGSGTMDYRSYDRDFKISMDGKPEILGSSDSDFLGDKNKHNPEDLLVSAVSSCHMLWYLHLCSKHGIVVMEYYDNAEGIMVEDGTGSGKFTSITLRPNVVLADNKQFELAEKLHTEANKMCFIANSLNFKVNHVAKFSSI